MWKRGKCENVEIGKCKGGLFYTSEISMSEGLINLDEYFKV